MSRAWKQRKQSMQQTLKEYEKRSPVMTLLNSEDLGDEVRYVVRFDTETLVLRPDRHVGRSKPVTVGIRYNRRFLAEAPHPVEIVCVLEPREIFHPNCSHMGMCLGHPRPGVSIQSILNQVWAGINFNMSFVRTAPGETLNLAAAAYVCAHAEDFPLNNRGLFEGPAP